MEGILIQQGVRAETEIKEICKELVGKGIIRVDSQDEWCELRWFVGEISEEKQGQGANFHRLGIGQIGKEYN